MGLFLIRQPSGGSYVRGPDFLRYAVSVQPVPVPVRRGRGGGLAPDVKRLERRRHRERTPAERPEEPVRLIAGHASPMLTVPVVSGRGTLRIVGRGMLVATPSVSGHGIVESEDWVIFGDLR